MIAAKKLAQLQSLQNKKDRQSEGLFIIDNPKVIFEQARHKSFRELYIIEEAAVKYKKNLRGIDYHIISTTELKKISPSVTPQGMVAVFGLLTPVKFDYNGQHVLLLDGIQDPGNVGTIIRTADWFGCKDIFLSKTCADIYNPKTVAASMGSIFNTNLYSDQDLPKIISNLKKHGFKIIVTDSHGEAGDLTKGNLAVVIGSEAHGASREIVSLADVKYKIKGSGQAESLNAAVAAGIMLYQLNSSR